MDSLSTFQQPDPKSHLLFIYINYLTVCLLDPSARHLAKITSLFVMKLLLTLALASTILGLPIEQATDGDIPTDLALPGNYSVPTNSLVQRAIVPKINPPPSGRPNHPNTFVSSRCDSPATYLLNYLDANRHHQSYEGSCGRNNICMDGYHVHEGATVAWCVGANDEVEFNIPSSDSSGNFSFNSFSSPDVNAFAVALTGAQEIHLFPASTLTLQAYICGRNDCLSSSHICTGVNRCSMKTAANVSRILIQYESRAPNLYNVPMVLHAAFLY